VHLNGFREGAISWPAPAIVVAHSCVTSWWHACRGGAPDEPRWLTYAGAVDAGLRAVDAWVAPTEAFRLAVQDLYTPPTDGVSIHNGIEIPRLRAHEKRDLILASGRVWDPAKGLAAVLAAAPHLPWAVEIAGQAAGPNGEVTSSAPNVTMLGALPRHLLLEKMREAAIYAAPARYEPFGLGILEAAAAGCALVLSDIPTMRELWDGAALFVPPGDNAGLAGALELLCGNSEIRHEFQKTAFERASRYSIQATAAQYRDLYDALLGRGSPALVHREVRA
jgi:glycogen synthase